MPEMTITVRCSACRADNSEGTACRRCKADLSLLWGLERQRAQLIFRADHARAAGDWEAFEKQLRAAAAIRDGADTARLLALSNLKSGRFADALNAYRQAANHG